MNKHLDDIACRRRILLAKIKAQKMEVAEISQHLQKPLAWVDRGIWAVHFIRRHPALMSSGVAVLVALRHKDFTRMAQEGWRLLCIYPYTAYIVRRFSAERRDSGVDS